MRRIATCAVAAFAALAMMIALGVASASAGTVLCSEAESVCANGNVRPSGSHVALGKGPSEGKFRIITGVGSFVCDYAVINSISTAELGNPLAAKSEVGVYPENCRAESKTAENCQALAFNNPGETIEGASGGSGTIYLGSKSEPLTLSFTCKPPAWKTLVSCSYKAESSIPIHYTYNGWVATIKSEESPMTLVSGPCGSSTGSLQAELEKAGGGFFSTHTATALCSEAESVCANGNVRPAGSGVAIGKGPLNGKFRFSIGIGPRLTCDYAVINSVSAAEFGTPLTAKSEVGVFPENCRFEKNENCQSLAFNSPGETIEGTSGGSGTVYLGSKSEPLTLSFTCMNSLYSKITPLTCSYVAEAAIPINYTANGWVATISTESSHMTKVSGGSFCTSVGSSLEAELEKAGGGFFSTV